MAGVQKPSPKSIARWAQRGASLMVLGLALALSAPLGVAPVAAQGIGLQVISAVVFNRALPAGHRLTTADLTVRAANPEMVRTALLVPDTAFNLSRLQCLDGTMLTTSVTAGAVVPKALIAAACEGDPDVERLLSRSGPMAGLSAPDLWPAAGGHSFAAPSARARSTPTWHRHGRG